MIDHIIIQPFSPESQAQVKNLILAGLAEHWGKLDPSLNPDLNDIANSYADGLFLVAWDGTDIVGTGALIPRSNRVAEIVRMSVSRSKRKRGIGRLILQRLIRTAQEQGYRCVILETTAAWEEVVQFYLRNGFCITHQKEGDVYFILDLENE